MSQDENGGSVGCFFWSVHMQPRKAALVVAYGGYGGLKVSTTVFEIRSGRAGLIHWVGKPMLVKWVKCVCVCVCIIYIICTIYYHYAIITYYIIYHTIKNLQREHVSCIWHIISQASYTIHHISCLFCHSDRMTTQARLSIAPGMPKRRPGQLIMCSPSNWHSTNRPKPKSKGSSSNYIDF